MGKKYAVFDMDGTLVDSMPFWQDLDFSYLASKGITELPPDLQERVIPMTMTEASAYFVNVLGVPGTPEQAREEMTAWMARHYETDIPLKPGVETYLRTLDRMGVRMCAASATEASLMDRCLTRLGVRHYFEFIVSCEDVGAGKSEPDIFLEAARRFDADPSELTVFEDSVHAAESARRAGCRVTAVWDAIEADSWEQLQSLADESITDWSRAARTEANREGHSMKTALSIASSDCSGGAGIEADLKTMTMNGVYAMSCITALNAQNTTGVFAVHSATPEILEKQIDAVFTDIRPDAVRVGMIPNAELVQVIGRKLRQYRARNVVVDPVMVTAAGEWLTGSDTVPMLMEDLLSLAVIVTPNIPEAEVLTGMKILCQEDMEKAAAAITGRWNCSVLIKGGHNVSDACDLLCTDGTFRWLRGKRIMTVNTHGTGCTLSSAIAANLAKGFDLVEAVTRAKEYVAGALSVMLDLGRGTGPIDHAFDLRSWFAEEAPPIG